MKLCKRTLRTYTKNEAGEESGRNVVPPKGQGLFKYVMFGMLSGHGMHMHV